MATYQPGSFQAQMNSGYVFAMDLHKPQIDDQLGRRYGNQYLSEFLMNLGYSKGVKGYEYFNFQEDRIYPKLKATTAGAAANQAATFTLANDSMLSVSLSQSPFVGSTDQDLVNARVGDILHIKPVTGVVNSSSLILARVETVNEGAGTFTAMPLEDGVSIPNIASATEIAITGNAFGEGSIQPKSRAGRVTKYSNNVQTFKETFTIPGTAKGLETWVEIDEQRFAVLKGEEDAYVRFLNARELALMTSKRITNQVLADANAANGEPILATEGLIPFIQSQGNTKGYSSQIGLTKADIEDMVVTLDSEKGAKQNMLMAGIRLSLQLDDVLADSRQNGAISFGSFQFPEDAAINYQISKFKIGEYEFNKKTMDSFNDLQSLGAEGYSYPYEGMVIPMDTKIDARSQEKIESLRIRYLEDNEGNRQNDTSVIDMFKSTESGRDVVSLRYKDTCGFEGIGGNRFFYIERQ